MSQLTTMKDKSALVSALFAKHKHQMALALPKHINPERMLRLALTACARNPDLLECTQASLVGSLMMAAQVGLEPDGTHGALVPYRNKGVLESQFQPMYRGLLKLAWNSKQIAGVQVDVVREKDHFVYQKGLSPALEHRPYSGDDEAGALTHAYAIITTTGGGTVWEVLPRREVESVKASSRAAGKQHSPWQTHEAEMWKKTALRRVLKLAPTSAEVQMLVSEDEKADSGIPQDLPTVDLGVAKAADAEQEPVAAGASQGREPGQEG